MKRTMKRVCRVACCLLALLAVLTLLPTQASAEAAYPSYTYNYNGQAVPTAMPYETVTVLGGDSLGIGSMDEPTDLYVTDDGEIFVLDAGNDRVVVLNDQLRLDRVITPLDEEGEPMDFKSPSGISVYHDGTIIICVVAMV